MARFKKIAVVVEATQWFANGDHPDDDCQHVASEAGPFMSEGKVVRRFNTPTVPGASLCRHDSCRQPMHDHGWIDTLEGGHIVCPGDWIITGVKGERYPCKPAIFRATYEPDVPYRAPAPIERLRGHGPVVHAALAQTSVLGLELRAILKGVYGDALELSDLYESFMRREVR